MIARRYSRSVWVLAVAALLVQAIPLHLHFHHGDDLPAAGSAHVAEVHLAGGSTDQEHHEDAHVFDLNSQGFFKQLDGDSLIPLLFTCLWAFLLLPVVHLLSSRPDSRQSVPYLFFTVSPPLRAPPRI